MDTKYDLIIKKCLDDFEKVKIDGHSSIEKLILGKSAEKELQLATEGLNGKIEAAISSFAHEHLLPKYEFTNIREQGLRIWGKDENIAISRFTLSQILHEMAAICDAESLSNALFDAGCKSGLQFFVDFLGHLRSGAELKIPGNETDFLSLLGSFDQRSAWWADKPIITQLENRVNINLKKPFTTYPWVENDQHTFNEFLSGYLLTLFNCSSDFLRIINFEQGNSFRSQYCVAVRQEQMKMVKPKMLYIKLFTTDMYMDEFLETDKIFFCSLDGFLNGGNGSSTIDICESPEYYRELISELKRVFPNRVSYEDDILKELSNRKKIDDLRHENLPSQLFVEIQLLYQKLKIETLFELDSTVQEAVEIENRGVD